MREVITVSARGGGDHRSIQAAVDAAPAGGAVIKIAPGEYREKLFIDKPDIELEGSGREVTILRWDDAAEKPWPGAEGGGDGSAGWAGSAGPRTGTFRSYTAFFGAPGFRASGLMIVNDAGWGQGIGQAIAAYVDAPDARFRACAFIGRQDTLFLGPLPPSPRIPGSFVGPGESRARGRKVHVFEDCLVAGDIDFIFGSAEALFLRCELKSLAMEEGGTGYVTAPSTPEGAARGFVFVDCSLTGSAAPASVYLGRPWRPYARAAFLGCRMGSHIAPAGWADWEGGAERESVDFTEGGSTGPGSDAGQRAPWSRLLDAEACRKAINEAIGAVIRGR